MSGVEREYAVSVTDYPEIEAALTAVGSQVGAAEAHGLLCGMAGGAAAPDKAVWIAQVLADTQPRGDEAKRLLAALVGLYAQTLKSLDDADLSFHPLLPADEAPLDRRARALGEWCAGFLAGIGLGGVDPDAPLSPEATEALRDLSAIAQVEVEPDEGEDNEAAYAELVEFVRVAAMLVHSGRHASRPPAAPTVPAGRKPH